MSWDELSLNDEQILDQPEYVDPKEINSLYHKVFTTVEGQKVLEHLRAITIEQPSFIPGESASYGYCREGQNSIIREIIKRIERARA